MRNLRLLLIPTMLFLFSFQAVARMVVQEEFYILDPGKQYMQIINMSGTLVVDHLGADGYELYGPKGTKQWLEDNKIPFNHITPNDFTKSMLMGSYPSHKQMSDRLKKLAKKFPKIAKLTSVGNSNQNRELWVMKISDNVNLDEIEPEVKYISTMHGDEIVGRELMMEMIEEMLENYGSDSAITELIDNTEIFIMPNMNPDGTAKRRRGNAKWTDLNRDFPDFTSSDENSWEGRAIETKHVMQWQASRNFALSANFHGGAVCVNYPWDATYTRHPFDSLIEGISLEYATEVPEMRNSTRFTNGITNGADWYLVHGGMQDWSYFWHGDLQVTIELSQSKYPSYGMIPSYYRDNHDSLFKYLERVHQGAGFHFADKENIEGTVRITKIDLFDRNDLGSYGFTNSEFYKVLEPGNYYFHISNDDGLNKTIEMSVSEEEIDNNGNYYIF